MFNTESQQIWLFDICSYLGASVAGELFTKRCAPGRMPSATGIMSTVIGKQPMRAMLGRAALPRIRRG